MNKMLLLVTCVVSLVAAGRITVNLERGPGKDRLTREDLQHEKFILDIVQRLEQPLQQDELIQLDQGLIVDAQRYVGGIDREMQFVLNLDRQRRLLDEHQVFSLSQVEQVEQLRGIYRLLVRADSFDIFQRNVVYLRRNINPVMLVNALSLALRDRQDTQQLIMPAIQELLPRQYLNQQVIEQVQQRSTQRPTFLDVMGVRQGNPMMNIFMPWRELHLQMALRRLQARLAGQERVVIPIESRGEDDMSLLTEDIRLRRFVENLIQEFALREYKSGEQVQQRVSEEAQYFNRVPQQSEIRYDNAKERFLSVVRPDEARVTQQRDVYQSLPSVDINSDRLLPFNRRRFNFQAQEPSDLSMDRQQQYQKYNERFLPDEDVNQKQARVTLQRDVNQGLPFVDINSDRLLPFNRRRFNFQDQQPIERFGFTGVVRGERFSEGRRVVQQPEEGQKEQRFPDNVNDYIEQRQRSQVSQDERVRGRQRVYGVYQSQQVEQGRQQTFDEEVQGRQQVYQDKKNQRQQYFDEKVEGRQRYNGDYQRQQEKQEEEQYRRPQEIQERQPVYGDYREKNQGQLYFNEEQNEQRRRNQEQSSQAPNRRSDSIVEGRTVVGEGSLIEDEDIIKFIRRENRLSEMSDEEILRLLQLNRQQSRQRLQEEQRFTPRRTDSIVEGRTVVGEGSFIEDEDIIKFIRRDNRLSEMSDEEILKMLQLNRQQSRQRQQEEQRFIPRRSDSIVEGRNVVGEGSVIQDEDIVKLIRRDNRLNEMSDEEILQMLQLNRQQRRQRLQNDVQQGHRYRRSLPINDQRFSRRNEILLHTLRQLVARLNQERITLRQGIINEQQFFYNPLQSQTERYALRLKEKRLDSLRYREYLQKINEIERRLELTIRQAVNQVVVSSTQTRYEDQRQVEERFTNALLAPEGFISILRELTPNVRLSDPLIQYLLRRIVNIVDEQREELMGVYPREQLFMPGVTINEVRLDKLRTRIEYSDLDLTKLVEPQQQPQTIVGRQRRLSSKPFYMDLDINSENEQQVIIRMFLGPREDVQGRQVSLEQSRRDFILLDAINVQLQAGRNRIQRRSVDIPWTSRDSTPYSEIYRRVMLQLSGQPDYGYVQELNGENDGFPQHLILPRGRPEGLPMQFLVIVSPVETEPRQQVQRIPGVIMGIGSASLQDIRPLGYPLDRRFENEQEFIQLNNVNLQDVVITQEI